jgi:uncharacterized protein (TIGR03437 family)
MRYYSDNQRITHFAWRHFGTLFRTFATVLFTIVPCLAQLPPGVLFSKTVPNSVPLVFDGPPLPAVTAVATDPSGNIYVTGTVDSNGLAATPGVVQSANAGGTCVYYVVFPYNMAECSDAFIAKFNSTGALVFLAYLGGSGADVPNSIVTDASGDIYVAGTTTSTNFPLAGTPYRPALTNGGTFIAELSSDGTKLIWSTVLNGNLLQLTRAPDGSLYDLAQISASNPVATLTKLSASGQLLASGSVPANTIAIAVGPDGSLYAGGFSTSATDVPATPGAWQTSFNGFTDGFVGKMNPGLSGFTWVTLVATHGGSHDTTSVNLMQAAPDGSVWFYGTTSAAIAVTTGAPQPPPTAGGAPYLVHLSADGSKALAAVYLPAQLASFALDSSGDVVFSTLGGGAFEATPGSPWPCMQQKLNGIIGKFDSTAQSVVWSTWTGPSVPFGPVSAMSGGVAAAGADLQGDVTMSAMSTTPGAPRLVSSCIAEAGIPFASGPLTPGQVFSIYGAGLGPEQGVSAQPSGNSIATNLAGVQVTIEGTPAPLLYVSAAQINAIAPYSLTGVTSAHIQVVTSAATSNELSLAVQPAAPEIFVNSSGLAIVNQDGTLNSQDHPAHFGDTVSMWVSGVGQTNPPGVDGSIPTAAGGTPLLPVTVQLQFLSNIIGNTIVSAPVTYAGNAPGLVSGIAQVNFEMPRVTPVGPGPPFFLTVVLFVGGTPIFGNQGAQICYVYN